MSAAPGEQAASGILTLPIAADARTAPARG